VSAQSKPTPPTNPGKPGTRDATTVQPPKPPPPTNPGKPTNAGTGGPKNRKR